MVVSRSVHRTPSRRAASAPPPSWWPDGNVVIGVGHAALGRGLVGHQIEPVIGAGDRAPKKTVSTTWVRRFPGVEGVGRGGGAPMIGRDTGTVEDIVLIGRALSLAVGHARHLIDPIL